MPWEGVEGVGSPVQEMVGGVEEGVEGVGPSVVEGIGSFGYLLLFFLLASSCLSRVIFLHGSCLLGSFLTFSDVLSMFILSKNGKG